MTAMAEVSSATVRKLAEADWAALRATRLAALADAPYAFSSTLAREQGFTEQVWRDRLGTSAAAAYYGADALGAGNGGAPAALAGLAALLRPGPASGLAAWHLVSMWVSPPARGLGLADRLITAVCDQARAEGAAEIELWVTLGNDRARGFYRRTGFLETGDRQLIRAEEPDSWEDRMVRPLR